MAMFMKEGRMTIMEVETDKEETKVLRMRAR